jgi:hypothetical protein
MSLTKLLEGLDGDGWRKENPFSPEVATVAEVLFHPYARDDERQLAIRGWFARHQPCVFGQVAAKADSLYIAIITDSLLKEGEDAVRERLKLEKDTWKQWSLEAKGRHGFVVVFASPQLHYAAPNHALRDVSRYLRDLFVEVGQKDPAGNDICYESLYLRNPETSGFVQFRVILDYFASAGDKRWWHDHRFPGGVAFTLNSLGHMVRTKEWYEQLKNPVEWAARMAMLTISNAYDHPKFGKATQLLDLKEGKPMKSHECPFAKPESLSAQIKGKDWTTYSGSHHTDHSIREEFFDQRDLPNRDRGEYLLDFMYLAGAEQGENAELTNGVPIDEKDVVRDIGSPNTWRLRKPPRYAVSPRSLEVEGQIQRLLSVCRQWLE